MNQTITKRWQPSPLVVVLATARLIRRRTGDGTAEPPRVHAGDFSSSGLPTPESNEAPGRNGSRDWMSSMRSRLGERGWVRRALSHRW